MAGIGVHDDRNRCSTSVRIGVHLRPEGVHDGPEYALCQTLRPPAWNLTIFRFRLMPGFAALCRPLLLSKGKKRKGQRLNANPRDVVSRFESSAASSPAISSGIKRSRNSPDLFPAQAAPRSSEITTPTPDPFLDDHPKDVADDQHLSPWRRGFYHQ
jgi:hypothetical protein